MRYVGCGAAGGADKRRIQQSPKPIHLRSINLLELVSISHRSGLTASRFVLRFGCSDRAPSDVTGAMMAQIDHFQQYFAPGLVPSTDHHTTRSLTYRNTVISSVLLCRYDNLSLAHSSTTYILNLLHAN